MRSGAQGCQLPVLTVGCVRLVQLPFLIHNFCHRTRFTIEPFNPYILLDILILWAPPDAFFSFSWNLDDMSIPPLGKSLTTITMSGIKKLKTLQNVIGLRDLTMLRKGSSFSLKY